MATVNQASPTSTIIAELIDQKRFAEARDALRQSVPDREHLALLYQLGSGLLHDGQFAPAEQAFRLVLTASPRQWEAAYALGVSLELQGKVQEAIGAFERACQLNPDSTASRTKLQELQHDQAAPGHSSKAAPRERQLAPAGAPPASLDGPHAPAAVRPLGHLLDQNVGVDEERLLREERRRVSSFAGLAVRAILLTTLGFILFATVDTPTPHTVAELLVPGDAEELERRIEQAEGAIGPSPVSEAFRQQFADVTARTENMAAVVRGVWSIGAAGFVIIGLLAIGYMVVGAGAYRYRLYPYRVEIASGLVSRTTTSIWLYDIRDVVLSRRPLELLTGNATVRLETDKGTYRITGFGDAATTMNLSNELRTASLVERRAMKRWWN